MSEDERSRGQPVSDGDVSAGAADSKPDIDRLLEQLEQLEETVDDHDERAKVRETMRTARRIPGSGFVGKHISKYTTRDMAEALVGGILLALPLLVEDGVFQIARWFLSTTVWGIPVLLVGNVTFIVLLTIGLVYWSDIREVQVTNPILGFVPRRLVGILTVTFLTSAFLFVFWGRHVANQPASTLELFSSITVVWAAAAIGGALGDILPGESKGHDIIIENLDDIIAPDRD